MRRQLLTLLGLIVLAASQLILRAQDDDPAPANVVDPPSRVARLNWLDGDVSFQPAGTEDWTAATLNYPITTGDRIATGSSARAELHAGGPNALRINYSSTFGVTRLDDLNVQTVFTEGSMEVRLRLLGDDDVWEIDTPSGAISLLRTGDYRIDADSGRDATMLTVRSGQAEVFENGNNVIVRPHQTIWFSEGRKREIQSENARDDFDDFTTARNATEDGIAKPVDVSPTTVGYEDLYTSGVWQHEGDLGWVWSPPVSAGWAPYTHGRWAWVEPWGWTWIAEEAWGFAPFHYGRWTSLRGSWVWVPDSPRYAATYAPALVEFLGDPDTDDDVAWVPLGPGEPYDPGYAVSNVYVEQINQVYLINNITLVNRRAATSIGRRDFTSGENVYARQRNRGGEERLHRLGGAPPLVPTRESLLLRPTRARPIGSDRQVFGRLAPPPPTPSFEARRRIIEQQKGRPPTQDQLDEVRRRQPDAAIIRGQMRSASGTLQTAPPLSRPARTVEPPSGVHTRTQPQQQQQNEAPAPSLQQSRRESVRQQPNAPPSGSRSRTETKAPAPPIAQPARPTPQSAAENRPPTRGERPQPAKETDTKDTKDTKDSRKP